MPLYRVIIARNDNPGTASPGTYCWAPLLRESHVYGGRYADDVLGSNDLATASAARALADFLASNVGHGRVTYVPVTRPQGLSWEALAHAFSGNDTSTTEDHDMSDHDDDDTVECDVCGDDHDTDDHECWECGEHGHGDDHENYYCEDCGWTCGVHECEGCLSYSDRFGGSLCDSCYEEHEHNSEGSPGLTTRACGTCNSLDVHHDDDRERFVCDHEARRIIAEGGNVTLLYTLPAALEVA